MSKVVLEAKDIYKHFDDGKSKVEVIKGLSLQVEAGSLYLLSEQVVQVKVLCCMYLVA